MQGDCASYEEDLFDDLKRTGASESFLAIMAIISGSFERQNRYRGDCG